MTIFYNLKIYKILQYNSRVEFNNGLKGLR